MLNWGRHNAQCLPVWKQSGPMLNAGCAHVGPSRAHVEPSWAYVGPSRAHVTHVDLSWAHLGPILGLSWPRLGLCWAMLGPSCVGPKVGPCWPMLGLCWPMGPRLGHLCWNDLKMPFCPPRALFRSPKPRKNWGFWTSPRWNSLPPKGPKHRKTRCFLTPHAQHTVNYRDFSRHGVVWGWFGGGWAAVPAAPITFGYHRGGKDTGSVAGARIYKRAAAPWSSLQNLGFATPKHHETTLNLAADFLFFSSCVSHSGRQQPTVRPHLLLVLSSLTRSPCRWLRSADTIIYTRNYMIKRAISSWDQLIGI